MLQVNPVFKADDHQNNETETRKMGQSLADGIASVNNGLNQANSTIDGLNIPTITTGTGFAYRKWPDGSIEQWGISAVPPAGLALVYPVPLKTITGYGATVAAVGTSGSVGADPGLTSMTLFQSAGGTHNMSWYVNGTYK